VQAGQNEITISVADHGPGIAEVELPYIWERFHRVDKSRSRALGGTGLGLAIVKQIIGTHGGRVGVRSKPGWGSVFSFTLPAVPENEYDYFFSLNNCIDSTAKTPHKHQNL